MRSWRENPDGAENTRATKDAEREIRNLQKYNLMKAMEWHPDLIGQIEVTDNMQTPNTKAGQLTELIMSRIRGKLPELPTHEYNRIYECVLGELNCHVLGETYEIPKPSAEPANIKAEPSAPETKL